jgi:pimeloyl-ACP methyl ester carboxylesterase
LGVEDGSVVLAAYDWAATAGEDAVAVFIHATGYHARVWDSVIARLSPKIRCIALDLRAHGLSEKPPPTSLPYSKEEHHYYPYPRFGLDCVEALDALGIEPGTAFGIGHSMGGATLLHAQVIHKTKTGEDLFARLVLCDPIVFPSDTYSEYQGHAMSDSASKRRKAFASAEAMFERFHERYPFSLWLPEALADYCRYGSVEPEQLKQLIIGEHATPVDIEGGEGGVMLACPPVLEAATFKGSRCFDARLDDEQLRMVQIPVQVLRAGTDNFEEDSKGGFWQVSSTDPLLASRLPNAEDFATGCSHFIPFEDPELVAQLVDSFFDDAHHARKCRL